MTKFYMDRFHVSAPGTQAYRDNYDRIFGRQTDKLCTCVDQPDPEKPCHCCGAEAGHACSHPKKAVAEEPKP